MTLDRPAEVTVTFSTTVGTGGRRRALTLAKVTRTTDGGPELIRVPLRRTARDRIRGRRSYTVVVDVAIRADGVTRRRRRKVLIRVNRP